MARARTRGGPAEGRVGQKRPKGSSGLWTFRLHGHRPLGRPGEGPEGGGDQMGGEWADSECVRRFGGFGLAGSGDGAEAGGSWGSRPKT